MLKYCALTGLCADRHPGHPFATLYISDGLAALYAQAQRPCLIGQCPTATRTGINDGRHIKTGIFHCNCSKVGIIIISDNDGSIPNRNTPIVHIIPHGRRQHHARDIIARKRQRALNRASGGHNLFRAHPPQPVSRAGRVWAVICQSFIAQHIPVIVDARTHGATA